MTIVQKISSVEMALLIRKASYASVATATILIIAKFVAWFVTGATSLLATLIDSLLDALASITNLLAIHYSLRPADLEHRFGHGKLESLAGLMQALFISGSGIFLIRESINKIILPQPLVNTEVGIIVMIFAVIVTALLLKYQYHVIKLTASTAIRADSMHYATDLLTNCAVLIALSADRLFNIQQLDPIFALGIAIYILYSAWQIAWEAAQILIDRELTDKERDLITSIARNHPQVFGISELKSRRAGNTILLLAKSSLS